MDGEPLSPVQKRAHVTLLTQAGADTTATNLGSTLRFLTTNRKTMELAHSEISAADVAGKLSTPVKFEEVRMHLPYFVVCIKKSLRLNPPATNLFARVTSKQRRKLTTRLFPLTLKSQAMHMWFSVIVISMTRSGMLSGRRDGLKLLGRQTRWMPQALCLGWDLVCLWERTLRLWSCISSFLG